MVVTAQYTFAAGLLEPERAESSKATDSQRRGGDFGSRPTPPNSPSPTGSSSAARSYLLKVWNKCKGAGGVPMPQDNWEKTAYTFAYVLVTLVAFSAIDEYAVRPRTDGAHTILLGSMGALCTLMYSAPASPLTQPRNVLFGHVVAAVVGAAVNAITGTTAAAVWARRGGCPDGWQRRLRPPWRSPRWGGWGSRTRPPGR